MPEFGTIEYVIELLRTADTRAHDDAERCGYPKDSEHHYAAVTGILKAITKESSNMLERLSK